ncbi:hypothetical protein PITC_015290 [Penicillium italicum]|uniref:Uncharacterized protein n=1 Tax=Penicillium italicum TaxID=40296 RepID=A0A0A2KU27_PENIT|nr:hypothetical protein PITC_015290 [Penicillium italicum]
MWRGHQKYRLRKAPRGSAGRLTRKHTRLVLITG